MSWTQKELEELYQKVDRALAEDPSFREKARKDARAAVEELAGRSLEEGFCLDFIEQNAGYGDTYVLPDFVGAELDVHELDAIAGGRNVRTVSGKDCPDDSAVGISVMTIVAACGAAGNFQGCSQRGPCAAYIPCDANLCMGEGCGSYAPPPCPGLAGLDEGSSFTDSPPDGQSSGSDSGEAGGGFGFGA